MNKLYFFSWIVLISLFYYGFQLESEMKYSKEIMVAGLTLSILSFIAFVSYQIKTAKKGKKKDNFHSENRDLNSREVERRNERPLSKKPVKTPPVYTKGQIHRKITESSTAALTNIYEKAIQTMIRNSCPCHYPRFRKLAEFHAAQKTITPVFCVDSNFLIQAATNPKLGFLTPVEEVTDSVALQGESKKEIIYACTKCDSIYKVISLAFKGNLKRLYLDTMVANFNEAIGAKSMNKFPVFQGFFSDDENSLATLRKNYVLGEEKDVFLHLIE